jgi:hypothetical protein
MVIVKSKSRTSNLRLKIVCLLLSLAAQARAGEAPAIAPESWRAAVDNAISALARLGIELAEATIARATRPAVMVVVRLIQTLVQRQLSLLGDLLQRGLLYKQSAATSPNQDVFRAVINGLRSL